MVAGNPLRLTRRQHRLVVRSVEHAEQTTGAQFCVYLGPTGDDPRAHAEAMFEQAGLHTRPAVLLLVSPDGRRVEVVTSSELRHRVADETCTDAVAAMTGRFATADMAGGIQRLATAAGPPPSSAALAAAFPDLIES